MQTTSLIKTGEKMLDKKLLKKIDEKTNVISHPTTVTETVNIWANGFPKALYEIWRKDCREKYNDIYYIKIWTDHLKAQAYDTLVDSAVSVVQKEEPTETDEKEEKDIPLIGDGVKENGK